jgi:hypothetical protein
MQLTFQENRESLSRNCYTSKKHISCWLANVYFTSVQSKIRVILEFIHILFNYCYRNNEDCCATIPKLEVACYETNVSGNCQVCNHSSKCVESLFYTSHINFFLLFSLFNIPRIKYQINTAIIKICTKIFISF